jgi:hypothetical protein
MNFSVIGDGLCAVLTSAAGTVEPLLRSSGIDCSGEYSDCAFSHRRRSVPVLNIAIDNGRRIIPEVKLNSTGYGLPAITCVPAVSPGTARYRYCSLWNRLRFIAAHRHRPDQASSFIVGRAALVEEELHGRIEFTPE